MGKTVAISEELHEIIVNKSKEKKLGVGEYVEKIIQNHITKEELVNKIWPNITVNKDPNDPTHIILTDVITAESVNIRKKDNLIYCDEDHSTGCIHAARGWKILEELEMSKEFLTNEDF